MNNVNQWIDNPTLPHDEDDSFADLYHVMCYKETRTDGPLPRIDQTVSIAEAKIHTQWLQELPKHLLNHYLSFSDGYYKQCSKPGKPWKTIVRKDNTGTMTKAEWFRTRNRVHKHYLAWKKESGY